VRGIKKIKRKKTNIGTANCNGDLENVKSEGAKERQEITKRYQKQKQRRKNIKMSGLRKIKGKAKKIGTSN